MVLNTITANIDINEAHTNNVEQIQEVQYMYVYATCIHTCMNVHILCSAEKVLMIKEVVYHNNNMK